MKTILMLAAAGLALGATAAEARDGCGPGGHRGAYGYCRPNGVYGARRVVVAPAFVVGRYYEGRGYWDGVRFGERRWHGERHEGWHDDGRREGWRGR